MRSKKTPDHSAMPPMTGLYNIQPDDDPYEHHYSVPELPPIAKFGTECVGIAKTLRSEIDGYLTEHHFSKCNDLLAEVFGKDAIGEFPSDRTMCFFVDHLAAFTPEFVGRLQSTVLAKFPLWRLLAQYSEEMIGVYPTGAWLGDKWIGRPFDATHKDYQAWLNDAKNYDEARFGPQRRQLRHVRTLIRGAREEARKRGVALLAIFDSFDLLYHPEQHAAWFLHSNNPRELSVVSKLAAHRTYAVRDQGEICPQFCKEFAPYTDLAPPFWLTAYLIPSASRHELTMKDSAGKTRASFVVEEVVSDSALMRRLLGT